MKYASSFQACSGAAAGSQIAKPSDERLIDAARRWIRAIRRSLNRTGPRSHSRDFAAASYPPPSSHASVSHQVNDGDRRANEGVILLAVATLTIVLYTVMFVELYRWNEQAPIFESETAAGIAAPMPWP